MLSGFNTNIRRRGTLFHVQSEDSGRDRPHIITHLYYGGTILASEKSSYEDRLAEADLPGVVKQLMEEQHKKVLRRLVHGEFDELIQERLGADAFEETAVTKTDTEPDTLPPAEVLTAPDAPQTAALPQAEATAPDAGADRGRHFGDGIVSEKPLDEVILAYLVENARKRKRRPQ